MTQHPDHYPDAFDAWQSWKKIEPVYTKTPVARWFSAAAIDWCLDWIRDDKKHKTGGSIVWINRPAFGLRLSERSGLPFFGEGGKSADGSDIDLSSGQVIASSGACGTGRNLQHFSRNLCLDIPKSPILWEQRIGRTHRPGQRAQRIEFDLPFSIIEDAIRFESACAHALYMPQISGVPKLALADLTDVSSSADLEGREGPQWRKSKKK
jgi:hypothetical protein